MAFEIIVHETNQARLLLRKSLGQENSLERIELLITPWSQISVEVLFEDPIVDQLTRGFVPQMRDDHLLHELRVVLEQEQMEFVTCQFAVLGLFLRIA